MIVKKTTEDFRTCLAKIVYINHICIGINSIHNTESFLSISSTNK